MYYHDDGPIAFLVGGILGILVVMLLVFVWDQGNANCERAQQDYLQAVTETETSEEVTDYLLNNFVEQCT